MSKPSNLSDAIQEVMKTYNRIESQLLEQYSLIDEDSYTAAASLSKKRNDIT